MTKKKVSLACEVCKSKNYNTPKSIDERLEIKKFCKKCGLHTMHKEEK